MNCSCSELCQHPGCWKSEIDHLRYRKKHQNGFAGSLKKQSCATSSGQVLQTNDTCGSLPRYNTLNLFNDEFCRDVEDFTIVNDDQENNATQWVPFRMHQHKNVINKSKLIDHSITTATPSSWHEAYLNTSCDQQHKTNIEENSYSGNRGKEVLKFRSLKFANDAIIDDDDKVLIWVPGKKKKRKKKKSDGSKKLVSFKIISGDDLPPVLTNSSSKRMSRVNSPAGCYLKSARRFSPLFPDNETDQFDIFQMLAGPWKDYFMNDSLQSDIISMPRSLQTRGIPVKEARYDGEKLSLSISTKSYEERSLNTSSNRASDKISKKEICNNSDIGVGNKDANQSQSSIAGSKKVPRRVYMKGYGWKPIPRSPIQLTRVSIPKRKIRKYPLFNHCSSSIKSQDLRDVMIEPLTSSEQSSEASLKSSLSETHDIVHDNIRTQCSPNYPFHQYDTNDTCRKEFMDESKNNNKVPFPLIMKIERNTSHMISSSRGSNRVDKDVSVLTDDLDTVTRSNSNGLDSSPDANSKLSGSTMAESHSTDVDISIDEEILKCTYDKYRSLTPYKTPCPSDNEIVSGNTETIPRQVKSEAMPNAYDSLKVPRKLLSQSMLDLNQYLPHGDVSYKVRCSFIKRDLSPSRCMLIRQQKQPSLETVPREMTVSQLPVIRDAQKLLQTDLNNDAEPNEQSAAARKNIPVIPQVTNCSSPSSSIIENEPINSSNALELKVKRQVNVKDNESVLFDNSLSYVCEQLNTTFLKMDANEKVISVSSVCINSTEALEFVAPDIRSDSVRHSVENHWVCEMLPELVDDIKISYNDSALKNFEPEDLAVETPLPFARKSLQPINLVDHLTPKTNGATSHSSLDTTKILTSVLSKEISFVKISESEDDNKYVPFTESNSTTGKLTTENQQHGTSGRPNSARSDLFHSPVMHDFSNVLETDFEIDEEILKAMNGIDDFLSIDHYNEAFTNENNSV